MVDSRRLALMVWIAGGLPLGGFAQTPAPAAGELAPLRGRAPTDADRRTLTQWIDKQIQAAATREPQNLAAFRRAFLDEWTATGTAEAYRQALADLAAEAFAKAVADPKNAQGRGALLCGMMMSLLGDMARPSAVPAALAGLTHPAEVVRNRAARCLGRIEAIPPAELPRVLSALQTAAGKEPNGWALWEMGATLAAKAPAEEAIKRLSAILKARLTAYQNRDLKASYGDAAAIDALGRLIERAGANPPPSAVQVLAAILKAATLNYVDLSTQGNEQDHASIEVQHLELVIDSAERALTAAMKGRGTAPAQIPAIMAKIRTAADTKTEDVNKELARWIGAPGTPGILNQDPFKLPAGLPDVVVAPPTTTAPAAK